MYIHYIALDNIHESDFVIEKSNGLIDFLFLYIKSPSIIVIRDQIYAITNPSVIFINSHTPHKYFPTGTEYKDDYLHFAVKDQTSFLNELIYPLNTPIQISNDSCISDLLHSIQNENKPDNKYSGKIISLLIQLLMIKVGEQWDLFNQNNTNIPHFNELLSVRNQIINFPSRVWTVEELAEQAHLSHAYFQVMYKKAFGVTCITDVINTKISHAKVLLNSTDLPVKQVAQELGYHEVYHFIRQFKKSTGLTPGSFRRKTIQA
ncbi:MAG: helix-turn-helix transcriptional regulator [Mobilitalea sp.]